MFMEWKPEYSVKVKEIDEQHQKIFAIINKLNRALEDGFVYDVLSDILKDLIDYTIYHFDTEEKYFEKFNYTYKAEHIKKHEQFKIDFSNLVEKINDNELEVANKLLEFIKNWIDEHLIEDDQKYVPCFKEHGLK